MHSRPQPKYRFPWRSANRFELLIDGDQFFPRMVEAVEAARRYVWLEMYLFESGSVATRFVDAFLAAVERGVSVKLLLDDFGARGLSRYDRTRLAGGGIEVVYYNPLRFGKVFDNFMRDHRKLLIVDGEVAFVGGTGIADEFNPPTDPERRWRETVVRIEGPVLSDWQSLFIDVWQPRGAGFLPPSVRYGHGNSMTGRVTIARGPASQEVKRSLLKRIRSAERRVRIATAYFIPPWKIRRALRRAAQRGVDVRLLLPGPCTDHPAVRRAGRRFYSRLLRAGVRIFEYEPRVLHSKTSLCDHWVAIGSSNMDRWNLRWNLEASQEVDDQDFAAQVEAMFAADFERSIECVYEEWLRRPWSVRFSEYVWGRVDLWLNRLGRGRRKN